MSEESGTPAADKGVARSSAFFCWRAVLLLVGDGVATMFILPMIRQPLGELGASWPWVTRAMFAVHPAVAGMIPLAVAGGVVAKEFFVRDVYVRRRINFAALVFAGLWVGALVAGVFLPLIRLMTTMAGQAGGTMPS